MKKEKVLSLKLADLSLPIRTQNTWIEAIMRYKKTEIYVEYGSNHNKRLKELANEITIGSLVEALEESTHSRSYTSQYKQPYVPQMRSSKSDTLLRKKLVELGLTQLDCILLPNKTVTTQMLRRLGKEKMKRLSILLLSTFSHKALERLENQFRKTSVNITIENLLSVSNEDELACRRNGVFQWRYPISTLNTRKKLQELGFRYEDGLFLQVCTQRYLAEDLMSKEGLSKKTAYKFARIAEIRKWVGDFFE